MTEKAAAGGAAPVSQNQEWQTAALLKDRTRRAIRDRRSAGESVASLAEDYGVPDVFIESLCAWQMFQDDPVAAPPQEQEARKGLIELGWFEGLPEQEQAAPDLKALLKKHGFEMCPVCSEGNALPGCEQTATYDKALRLLVDVLSALPVRRGRGEPQETEEDTKNDSRAGEPVTLPYARATAPTDRGNS